MVGEQERVETDDMGLVAYLITRKHEPEEVIWDPSNRVCRWFFKGSRATDDASLYLDNSAMVNPRIFSRAYARAKAQFKDARDLHYS